MKVEQIDEYARTLESLKFMFVGVVVPIIVCVCVWFIATRVLVILPWLLTYWLRRK